MNNPQTHNEKNRKHNPFYTRKDYSRLKILYGISKILSNFVSIEESFPEILTLGSEGFPLLTAILIEHWEEKPRTTIWRAVDATDEQVDLATVNARKAYSYLAGNSRAQTKELQEDFVIQKELDTANKSEVKAPIDRSYYITLPLIINKLSPLGVLQFQGSVPLNEFDLDFVNALTDLIIVALDRYYKTRREIDSHKNEADINAFKISLSQEKVAELETERELREVFVSLLTHDLRTPLSAALMSAQLIMRKPNDGEACLSLAGRIQNNIKRADQMIENLLDANRIRSGEKLPLALEPFEMASFIKDTLDELTTTHGDRFVFKAGRAVEGHWDRKSLRRLIENLCNNAIKYGASNSPVTVSLHHQGAEIQISVSNLGDVISAEDQNKLFMHFKRGEKAESGSTKGWGLGLTLVQGVAEAHGGSVTVSSNADATTFTVCLPIDLRPNAESTLH
jgi:signal transduction histidine kinase